MEPNENNPDRLDQMLRNWGARVSTEEVDVPPRRVVPGGQFGFGRWAPLVAAGVLLAVSAAIVLFSMPPGATGSDESRPAGDRNAEIRRLREELRRARSDTAVARRQLAEAAGKLADQERLSAQLRRQMEDEIKDLLARRKAEWSRDKLRPVQEALKVARAKLTAQSARVEMLEQKLAASDADPNRLADLKASLESAREELQATRLAMGKQERQLDALRTQAKRRKERMASLASAISDLREQQQTLVARARGSRAEWIRLSRVYIGALAPGRKGVPAVVVAADAIDLGERLADVQRQSDLDETTRALLATLEVIAVRMDLIDPADADQSANLLGAIGNQKVMARIDAALRDPGTDARVADLLAETKLLLTGLIHAV